MLAFLQTYYVQILVIGFTVAVIVVFIVMINRSAKKHFEKEKQSKHRKYQR
jgi:mannose/fructose/N-acetylgalactosamine-specific phosphotransferase system component IIC